MLRTDPFSTNKIDWGNVGWTVGKVLAVVLVVGFAGWALDHWANALGQEGAKNVFIIAGYSVVGLLALGLIFRWCWHAYKGDQFHVFQKAEEWKWTIDKAESQMRWNIVKIVLTLLLTAAAGWAFDHWTNALGQEGWKNIAIVSAYGAVGLFALGLIFRWVWHTHKLEERFGSIENINNVKADLKATYLWSLELDLLVQLIDYKLISIGSNWGIAGTVKDWHKAINNNPQAHVPLLHVNEEGHRPQEENPFR